MSQRNDELVAFFTKLVNESKGTSVGLAVIHVLTKLITESTANTLMGIDQEISKLLKSIKDSNPNLPLHFDGAAQVFRAGLAKASISQNEDWKTLFVAHAQQILNEANQVLSLIPSVSSEFLQHGMVILTRGYDSMVASVLNYAVTDGRQFHVVVTEGRPHDDGCRLAASLKHPNLKVTVIPDSAVGLWMSEAHAVLLGTDLVLEDGGLLAPVGTYSMCVLASVHKKPVYCVCETFKFMRKFILGRSDLAENQRKVKYSATGVTDNQIECDASEFDYTPAKFVTLLLTEKGPMPPSAVTHELTTLLGVS